MICEYHRRWHRGFGLLHALMRTPEVERARACVPGVPRTCSVRGAAGDLAACLSLLLSGDAARPLAAGTRLWFFSGCSKRGAGA